MGLLEMVRRKAQQGQPNLSVYAARTSGAMGGAKKSSRVQPFSVAIAEETRMDTYALDQHGTVYAYLPQILKDGESYPLVIALNCTTGDPQGEVTGNGWDTISAEENIIVPQSGLYEVLHDFPVFTIWVHHCSRLHIILRYELFSPISLFLLLTSSRDELFFVHFFIFWLFFRTII